MKGLALTLALLAVPTVAQDLSYSDAQTQACLSGLPQEADGMACVGLSAQACMSTSSGGYSTVGMRGCLDRELTFWDALLNTNYRAQMARARQADAEKAGYNAPSQADALLEMQRAWMPFRDAACDYARSQWGGGTGGGPATLICLMNHTARQALLLGERFGQ